MLNPNFIEHFPEDHEYYTDTMVESSNHRWDCMLDYARKYNLKTKESTILYQPGVIASAVFHTFSGEITLTLMDGTVEQTGIESFDEFLTEYDISCDGWQIQGNEPINLQSIREKRKENEDGL